METQLLRDKEIYPSRDVLQNALGKVYEVFEEFETLLTQSDIALTFNWHYYRDGNSWLCKVSYKKKTIFWLSVWDGFFKTSFFFLERHLQGIADLEINHKGFAVEKEWGKMIPFIFNVVDRKQFPDLLKIVDFKKKAK